MTALISVYTYSHFSDWPHVWSFELQKVTPPTLEQLQSTMFHSPVAKPEGFHRRTKLTKQQHDWKYQLFLLKQLVPTPPVEPQTSQVWLREDLERTHNPGLVSLLVIFIQGNSNVTQHFFCAVPHMVKETRGEVHKNQQHKSVNCCPFGLVAH